MGFEDQSKRVAVANVPGRGGPVLEVVAALDGLFGASLRVITSEANVLRGAKRKGAGDDLLKVREADFTQVSERAGRFVATNVIAGIACEYLLG